MGFNSAFKGLIDKNGATTDCRNLQIAAYRWQLGLRLAFSAACIWYTGTETCRRYVFNLLKPTGHVMHQQFNIQQLYALSTLYSCVLYLSENKQRLVPLTAKTDWFL